MSEDDLAGHPDPIKVMIVDDHAVVRRGLRSFFSETHDIVVVAEAESAAEATAILGSASAHGELPDVVLLDIVMPGIDGAEATAEIRRRHPALKIVILTSYSEIERVHTALANGASGYVLKDADPAEVESAIRASTKDEVFLDPAVARRLTQRLIAPVAGLGLLSVREREVLVLLAHGLSNREIAAQLTISERTARTHVSNVLGKLHLTSRTQAALVAVREGLVHP